MAATGSKRGLFTWRWGKNWTRLTALPHPQMPQHPRKQSPDAQLPQASPSAPGPLQSQQPASQQPNPRQTQLGSFLPCLTSVFSASVTHHSPSFRPPLVFSLRLEQLGLSDCQFLTIASFFCRPPFSALVARALGDAVRRFSLFLRREI